MYHKRPWSVVLMAILAIALLVGIGSAIHRSGWVQGYMMGQLAAGSEGGTVVPYAPYAYPGHSLDLGSFLGVILVLGLGVALFKLFMFRAWKRAGGPEGRGGDWPWPPRSAHWNQEPEGEQKEWARFWQRHHGPMFPWCWNWPEPSEEKTEEPAPDASTDG